MKCFRSPPRSNFPPWHLSPITKYKTNPWVFWSSLSHHVQKLASMLYTSNIHQSPPIINPFWCQARICLGPLLLAGSPALSPETYRPGEPARRGQGWLVEVGAIANVEECSYWNGLGLHRRWRDFWTTKDWWWVFLLLFFVRPFFTKKRKKLQLRLFLLLGLQFFNSISRDFNDPQLCCRGPSACDPLTVFQPPSLSLWESGNPCDGRAGGGGVDYGKGWCQERMLHKWRLVFFLNLLQLYIPRFFTGTRHLGNLPWYQLHVCQQVLWSIGIIYSEFDRQGSFFWCQCSTIFSPSAKIAGLYSLEVFVWELSKHQSRAFSVAEFGIGCWSITPESVLKLSKYSTFLSNCFEVLVSM